LIPDNVGVFLDDVAMKNTTPLRDLEEVYYQGKKMRKFIYNHLLILKKMFQLTREAGVTFSSKKVQIAVPRVQILGYTCDQDGRHPVEDKVKKIQEWPTPKNVTQVRAFAGLAGYYRLWIKDFAIRMKPLYNLMKKNASFEWTQEQENAFQRYQDCPV
jgi:hypothetical protein